MKNLVKTSLLAFCLTGGQVALASLGPSQDLARPYTSHEVVAIKEGGCTTRPTKVRAAEASLPIQLAKSAKQRRHHQHGILKH